MNIDVYAEDLGWLFEDLKRRFAALDLDGITITAGSTPSPDADAWVALRTREIDRAPDPRRTVACIHDFDDERQYLEGGSRQGVRVAGGIVLCHPDQREYLAGGGIAIDAMPALERPIGALEVFRPRRELDETFRVGWVGRNHLRKRIEWLPETIARVRLPEGSYRVLLVGRDLADLAEEVRSLGVGCDHLEKADIGFDSYPALYASMGCLLVTSRAEAGPLTLFEALATGVPVVSTPVGWGPLLASSGGPGVTIATDPAGLAGGIEDAFARRHELFARRAEIAAQVGAWSMEGWMEDVVRFAASVAVGARGGSRIAGPHVAAPHVTGTHAAGTHVAGTHAAGTHVAGTRGAGASVIS